MTPRAAALLLLLGLSLAPRDGAAIPPFARRYGMSCTTCHVGGPTKLTIFGEAFRDNGYQIPGGDEGYLREEPMPLGDKSRAGLFPGTVWPGELPATVPLGVYATVALSYLKPTDAAAPAQTQVTTNAVLLIGANAGDHIALYGALFERGFLTARSLFDKLLGPGTLNLKIGRIDLDWFAVQPHLRRALQLPFTQSLAVGKDGFTLGANSDALELYGLLGGRVKWVVGAARGAQPFDAWVRPDVFARVSTRIGGERLDFRGGAPGSSSPTAASLALGVSGYWGLGVSRPDQSAPPVHNEILRLGGDARLRVGAFDILAQVVLGSDADPLGRGARVEHLAWLLEAEWSIYPWLIPYARFEEALFTNPDDDRQRIVAGVALFIRTNIRVRLEAVIGTFGNEPTLGVAELFFAM